MIISQNKKEFINLIKRTKNFDLTESVNNYNTMTRCFIEDFWGEPFKYFTEGRLVEREKQQDKLDFLIEKIGKIRALRILSEMEEK